jgi:arginine-tRNA-protein transferase
MTTEIRTIESAMHVGDITDACSYLPGKISTLSFGNGLIGGSHYRQLLDRGYRRSGMYLYRPVCRMCRQCQVIRVPVAAFSRNKEQRRVWRRGQEKFTFVLAPPAYTPEKAQLYERYLRFQHDAPTEEQDPQKYEHFLVDSCLGVRTVELQLISAGE